MNANGKYLIEQHTIQTAPSIQVLSLTHQTQRERRANRNTNLNALVVGNPIMPKLESGTLSSLPGAEQEARAVAALLKTAPLIGRDATKTEVTKRLSQARIVHLATHGLLDRVNGDFPGAIALAPSKPNQINDGLLTTNEIFDLKLNAELVVLSACDTAQGDITGDGVVGLSRSFIAAGVPSVMVSLWKVGDESTEFLMRSFYQNVQKGSDRASALRNAMLTSLQHPQYQHPYDWAAFTLIGEVK
jgi:CHAT domain-containing protein